MREEASKIKKFDWDFITNSDYQITKKSPISLSDNPNENKFERLERFLRQLNRCVISCTLCEHGKKEFKVNDKIRDPQTQFSIDYHKIMMIKFKPDENDIDELFGNLRTTLSQEDLRLNMFSRTSIIKCPNASECPYWDIEFKARLDCMPKILLIFDENSAKTIGVEFNNSQQNIHDCKIICIKEHKDLLNFIKTIKHPEVRKFLS